ncbi:MAG: cell wall hydrolase [Ruminococcus sp.]|nr:cell wall hydrolase [Ruminococcus sp.]
MSKGKTAVCVCAMVATCITGGVFIAEDAMSGNTVGRLSDSEVFDFDSQQLANATPNFAEPIFEDAEVIIADTENYTIPQMPEIIEPVADIVPDEEIPVIPTEPDVTETIRNEEAVTITSTFLYDESQEGEVDISLIATSTTIAETTTIAVTETTTTTITPAVDTEEPEEAEEVKEESPEDRTISTTIPEQVDRIQSETTKTEFISFHHFFSEPAEWLYMATESTETTGETIITTTTDTPAPEETTTTTTTTEETTTTTTTEETTTTTTTEETTTTTTTEETTTTTTTEETTTTTTTEETTTTTTTEETTTTTTEETTTTTTTTEAPYIEEIYIETTTEYYEEYNNYEDNAYNYDDSYNYNPSYVSDYDYVLLCNAVAHEAGSSWIDIYSKAYVVEVIMNRVSSPLFPDTVYDVLTQPNQFEGSGYYTWLGTYSSEVTNDVISAVDLYFSNPYDFSQGYMYFFGDGYQNHFSVNFQ